MDDRYISSYALYVIHPMEHFGLENCEAKTISHDAEVIELRHTLTTVRSKHMFLVMLT